MLDVGCIAGSMIFLLLGASIVLFPRALNKTVVQIADDPIRYPMIRYLLGLAAIAVGWVLFRLSIFLPPFGR